MLLLARCSPGPEPQVVIHTNLGDIRVRLYHATPHHRTQFLRRVHQGLYDSTRIHRVVRDGVIQGGRPLPGQRAEPTLPTKPGAPLLRGALCAARTGQADDGAEFFIVQGRPQTDAELDRWERKLNLKFSPAERQAYLQQGGLPQWHGQFTVFGAVTEGLDVVDRIAALPHDGEDQPLREVVMWVESARQDKPQN